MQMILTFKPIKNTAFRYYGVIESSSENGADISASTVTVKISKDGGVFATASNSPVKIDSGTIGYFYIDLTATEMNADVVCVEIGSNVANAKEPDVIIYTTNAQETKGVANFTSELLAFLNDAVDLAYKLTDVDLSNGAFNYYGFQKTGTSWVIVKESVSNGTTTLVYATRTNNSGKSYTSAWNIHSNLTYASTQTLI